MQRAEEKSDLICSWLAIFGHSTEEVLLRLLGVQARGACRRLQRAGLLLEVRVRGAKSLAWGLTATGVRKGEQALGRRVQYLSHPGRLTLSRFVHELAVQREALVRLPTDRTALRRLRADRELRSFQAAVRPDLLVRHVDDKNVETIVCLEVEVSPKSARELRDKLRNIRDMLTPRMQWVWFLSASATRDRYARLWKTVVDETHSAGQASSVPWLLRGCIFEVAQG